MIKGKGVSFLDGDFKKRHPTHGQHAELIDGKWFVYKYGPRYANTYEVTEFDDEGLKMLQSMKAPE